jgi:hypothetical protein
LLQRDFILSDKPRHAIELFNAPLVASGRAGCEVTLLLIE